MTGLKFDVFLSSLCQTVRRLRKEKGISQGAVADKLGKPQSTVARFESGKINDLHLSFVFLICQAIEEDLVDVISQAISAIIIGQSREDGDVDSRWTTIKEKVALLKADEKKELIGVLEGIFKLM